MKILPYNTNKVFKELAKETVAGAVQQSLDLIEISKTIHRWSLPKEEYVSYYGPIEDGEDFGYLQLDELETRNMDIQYKNLEIFARSMSASSDVLNRRTANAVSLVIQLQEKLTHLTERYIPLNAGEMEMLRNLSSYLIGDLAYFVYYQFDLDKTDDCHKEGRELEVNVLISQWCDLNGMEVEEVLFNIKQMMEAHKPTLNIFEEFPDLEDKFWEAAGPYAMDFDTYRDYVTKEHVVAVIDGTAPMKEVLENLMQLAGAQ